MKEEIKPCPFCGGKVHASTREKLFICWNGLGNKKIDFAAQVICNKCHARGGIVTEILVTDISLDSKLELLKKRAVEAWNRRASE